MGRKSWIVMGVMLALLVLAGCGQKGPLYREAPEEEAQTQAPQSNEYAARLG